MRPALKSVGLTLLLVCSTTIALCVPTIWRSPALAQSITTQDPKAEGDRLLQQGIKQYHIGQLQAAIESWQQALSIYRSAKQYRQQASALLNLGLAFNKVGHYELAIQSLQQVLAINKQQLNVSEIVAQTLNNLGIAYEGLGQYQQSVSFYNEALKLYKEQSEYEGVADTLHNLGILYVNLGQHQKAVDLYMEALKLTQQFNYETIQAGIADDLGTIYSIHEQYDSAILYNQIALNIYRKTANRREEARALHNRGSIVLELRRPQQAIQFFQQALAIKREFHDYEGEANSLHQIALALSDLGQYQEAIQLYQESLLIERKIGNRKGESITLNNIGNLLEKQKQLELAIVFYKQSVNIREGIREGIRTLPRDSQEAYTQSVAGTYRSLADLLIDQGRILEAQAVLELLKVQELKDFDRATRAKISNGKIELDPTEQAIVGKYTTFVEFGQKLRDCQNSKPQCADYDNLTKLRIAANAEYAQAVKSFEAAIKERKDKDEKNFLDPNNALNRKAQEIITAQPNTPTAIIYSLVTDDRLWLVLVTKGEALRSFETKLPQGELNETVRKFRALLEQCETQTCTAADTAAFKVVSQQLYGWLFPPALQQELQRGKIKHLVFAQDRITRYIPMAALFDGKQYLIENYAVSTIISASFTYNDPPPKRQAISVLAAGLSNPVPPKFGALENVPKELNAIVQSGNTGIFPGLKLLNQTFDFLGLQKNLYGHNILHIATHGEFVRSQADASYILLGNGKPLPIPDIMQLSDLGSVYLVVLSACQTALADRGADGIEISNVSYSFLEKGVKAVIASLWQVNDASTSELMQQFYKQLSEGKPKVQALQEAQLSLLQHKPTTKDALQQRATLIVKGAPPSHRSQNGDFSHPYYWAPFILIGNGL